MGKNRKSKIIAIGGVTGSGKSLLAKFLHNRFGSNKCVVICQDNYYKGWLHLSRKRRKTINFDEVRVFDLKLLGTHLKEIKAGNPISMPKYDFIESRRLKKISKLLSKPIVIIEGLMPFINKKLRRLLDLKIYIHADNSVCLARRIRRDIKERGETIESVCYRYFNDVLPMQKKYVEPQKKWANVVVNGNQKFSSKLINRLVRSIANTR
ncbi:MAG: uridine kinase [Candidatus Omnitrophota bacterium]